MQGVTQHIFRSCIHFWWCFIRFNAFPRVSVAFRWFHSILSYVSLVRSCFSFCSDGYIKCNVCLCMYAIWTQLFSIGAWHNINGVDCLHLCVHTHFLSLVSVQCVFIFHIAIIITVYYYLYKWKHTKGPKKTWIEFRAATTTKNLTRI